MRFVAQRRVAMGEAGNPAGPGVKRGGAKRKGKADVGQDRVYNVFSLLFGFPFP